MQSPYGGVAAFDQLRDELRADFRTKHELALEMIDSARQAGGVVCHSWLGGLLRHYQRAAA